MFRCFFCLEPFFPWNLEYCGFGHWRPGNPYCRSPASPASVQASTSPVPSPPASLPASPPESKPLENNKPFENNNNGERVDWPAVEPLPFYEHYMLLSCCSTLLNIQPCFQWPWHISMHGILVPGWMSRAANFLSYFLFQCYFKERDHHNKT